LYGTRPKGYFERTKLENAGDIDGTLFIRTGGLLRDTLLWKYQVTVRVGGVDKNTNGIAVGS
jgi:hypothetical protein